jgi:rfaE bifunctional protein nucleotidyltransferase chain/domain
LTKNSLSKIKTLQEIVEQLSSGRKNKTVVFTNGCFDLLHPGHIDFLERARGLGDFLVVGINSDASVKKIKGGGRPIVSEADRLKCVAALSCTSFVFSFNETTPVKSIKTLQPDIHVKGKDYSGKELPESEAVVSYGGKIVLLPLLEGYSTTSIIKKILGRGGALCD